MTDPRVLLLGGGSYVGEHIITMIRNSWQNASICVFDSVIDNDVTAIVKADVDSSKSISDDFTRQLANCLLPGIGYKPQSSGPTKMGPSSRLSAYSSSTSLSDCSSAVIVEYVKGDMMSMFDLKTALGSFRPTVVIHLAATGMSGPRMLDSETYRVNVEGTKNVIQACKLCHVPALVYISTYNVIFGGREIINGDESMPYFPSEGHTDYYSASKAAAEKLVIEANGSPFKDAKGFMLTCSLRPAAIYGEGEQRHLPRIIRHIDQGIFLFRIGRAKVDWLHVDNLAQAVLKAARKLSSQSILYQALSEDSGEILDLQAAPAGRCYFISDGTPVDNFEFLRPICQARGQPFPVIELSTRLVLCLAWLLESIFAATRSKWISYPIEPFMTRAEVYKVGVSHYFSIARARKDLGYEPAISSTEGADRLQRFYSFASSKSIIDSNSSLIRDTDGQCSFNKYFFRLADGLWWALIPTAMTVLGYFAYFEYSEDDLLVVGPLLRPLYDLAIHLFGSQERLRVVFCLAVTTHSIEAIFALCFCRVLGCSNYFLWGLQTFILGGPSLYLLMQRKKYV